MRSRNARYGEGQVGQALPPYLPSPLLLPRRLCLIREEALNLLPRVVDLDVERHLAERSGGLARVAGDPVVLARRRVRVRLSAAARSTWWSWIALRRRDQLLAYPPFV